MRQLGNGPVLVAGGGIGGLAAAVALRRHGLDVEVFERAESIIPERGTALTLWGNAVTVLDRLGVGDPARAAGCEVTRSEIRSHTGELLIETPVAEVTRLVGAPSMVMRRADLLRILYDALDGVPVHVGSRCTGYQTDGARVTLTFDDGATVSGSALVAADGARSVLRERLIGDGEPIPVGSPIWRGISDGDGGLDAGLALLIWGPRGGGMTGAHSAPDQVAWSIATNSRTDAALSRATSAEERKSVLLEFVRGLSPELEEAVRRTPARDLISGHVLVRKPTATCGCGPITLLGDAAHAMPTALGQGGCQALEDGYVLGESLAAADEVQPGLRRYEEVRRNRVSWLRAQIDRIDRFSRLENVLLCKIRNIGARLAPTGSVESFQKILTIDP